MNAIQASLFWYDYETTGTDPQKDRIVQFAGLRTDLDFNPVDDPVNIYCSLSDDILPQPEACLVTGITPQQAQRQGLAEAEFSRRVLAEMARPHTCTLGYNSIRFDDEFTRYLLYRNLFDAYAREWQNGNSRWDIIDMVRGAYALRPDGIEWPTKQDGTPSFKLEDLARANGIGHTQAHDALSDVYATIGLAKLIQEKQPRFYQYVFTHRRKEAVFEILSLEKPAAVVHVSSKYAATRGCLAVVAALGMHPVNKNAVIVYDLSVDPAPFLSLSVDELQQRLFVPASELGEGMARLPVKLVHANKCPVLAPLNTVDDKAVQRFALDLSRCQQHLQQLLRHPEFRARLPQAFASSFAADQRTVVDPEQALYSGGFFSNEDRSRMERLHRLPPQELAAAAAGFRDPRLGELLFRYRARNFPQTLTPAERQDWAEYRRRRLCDPEGGGSLTLADYRKRIDALLVRHETSESDKKLLLALQEYADGLEESL